MRVNTIKFSIAVIFKVLKAREGMVETPLPVSVETPMAAYESIWIAL